MGSGTQCTQRSAVVVGNCARRSAGLEGVERSGGEVVGVLLAGISAYTVSSRAITRRVTTMAGFRNGPMNERAADAPRAPRAHTSKPAEILVPLSRVKSAGPRHGKHRGKPTPIRHRNAGKRRERERGTAWPWSGAVGRKRGNGSSELCLNLLAPNKMVVDRGLRFGCGFC